MVETVINAEPCRDCGLVFERPKKKGRPPVRCEECRAQQTVDQEIIVSLIDPESLYTGPTNKLLGTENELPQGNEAQCPLCWRIFTSDSSCECHKIYEKDYIACKDPATIGMVPRERRGIPVWTRPSNRVFEEEESSGQSN